ncbi:hypothetical protein [Nonomuraea dietziae]|uniref:hypothetical protein n=1 Tax=Nonomuraea dietziae TaxID=65515 RepID=UPI003448CF20
MMLSRRERLRHNPFGTVAAAAAVVLGALGLALGDDVSQGMTNSLRDSAGPIAHLWGAMFSAGGVLKLYGLYWHRSMVEIPGLWMMTGGYAFYAITVVTGLGMHGLAAGIISAALTLGCLLKVRIIMGAARAAAVTHDREDGA